MCIQLISKAISRKQILNKKKKEISLLHQSVLYVSNISICNHFVTQLTTLQGHPTKCMGTLLKCTRIQETFV